MGGGGRSGSCKCLLWRGGGRKQDLEHKIFSFFFLICVPKGQLLVLGTQLASSALKVISRCREKKDRKTKVFCFNMLCRSVQI